MILKKLGVITKMFRLVIPNRAGDLEGRVEEYHRFRWDSQNNRRMWLLKFPFAALVILFFSAVSPVYSQVPPTIASFSPLSGTVGSTITIIGTNFSAAPLNNIVFFGGVKAAVSSASPAGTQLSVTVPVSASYAPISLTVGGLTAYSTAPFIPTFPGGGALSSSSYFPRLDFTTGSLPYGVAVGDLDGDGKPDIVVTNYTDNTISVYRNTNVGDSITANSFSSKADFAAGSHPWGVAIGDLDGDGKLDVVVSDGTSGSISVFRNTSVSGSGAISFAAKVDFATGGSGYGVAVADLDGDGKPDVVVTNRNGNSVSVLRNTSSGSITFAPNVDFAAGILPYGIAVSDLDRDEKPDLVTANLGDSTLSVFRNTSTIGNISFAVRVNISASASPIAVAIADVNGDGNSDIVSANNGNSTISVFQNNSSSGNIIFAAGTDFSLGGPPNSIAAVDVNGDGQPDIVVANGDSAVTVFRNTSVGGIASFAPKTDFVTGNLPYGLAVGDLNGDGRPDLIVTNSATNVNSVSILQSVVGAPSINISKASIDFGYVAIGDSAKQDFVLRDVSPPDSLIVDTIYANKKEIGFSKTHGSSVDSLKVSIILRADTAGLLTDTIFIKSNALTPLLKIPLSARVYSRPGRPAASAVTPAGWSNAAAFTITWTNPHNGMLPIDSIRYSINTLPKNAAVVQSIFAVDTSAAISLTQVGRDTVYFVLEDSLGNWNPDSTGSIIIKYDNNGPLITPNSTDLDTIVVRPDGTLAGIPPVVASAAEPPNESGVMALTLLYRRLDEPTWTTANFSNDTSAIPPTSFIRNGVVVGAEYRIQAVDSAGNFTLSNLLSFEIRFASDLSVNNFADIPSVHSLNLPVGQEVKAYRIFSIPYVPEDERPSSFIEGSFGPHSDKGVPYVNWRMVRLLNGGWNDYDSFKDSSLVIPGSGFMIVSENQGNSATLAKPRLIRADKMLYTGVKLNQGWNLVGNPFLVDIPFGHLIFQGGSPLVHYYFSGTGPQGGWEGSGPDVDTLRSWQGLAVRVDSACTLKFDLTGMLLPPAAGSNKRSTQTLAKVNNSQQSKEWTLAFDAVRDDIGMTCAGNEVGMRLGALKGLDKSDRFQAPFIGSHNILVNIENEAGQLMRDIRPLNADGDVWELTVTTGDGFAKTKLTFNSVDEISRQGFQATLVDFGKGLAYDLKTQKTILGTTGKDGVGKYRLIVGTSSFIEKNLGGVALVPNEPGLYNNYPNPFNPETIIRYAVPNAMKTARVLLKVYNVLGQEVRTLVDETVTPGFYEVSFDGKNVSSGTYFYRISIAGGGVIYHQTKKMLLIR